MGACNISLYLALILGYVASETLPLDEDGRPTLVVIAFRPGLQDPGKLRTTRNFGNDDDSSGEMTSYGQKQSYALGQFLRKRYGDIIPAQFTKDQVKAVSSSQSSSQTTMQMVLAGLFSKKSAIDFDGSFASYEVDDTLLKMDKSVCPEYLNVVEKFRDDSTKEVKDWMANERPIIEIVSQEIGLNASLINLVALGANIMHRRYIKPSDGPWTNVNASWTNLTAKVFEKLSQYADAPSTLCANDRSCRRLLAGYWVNSIFEELRKKQSTNSSLNLILYSSPADSLLSAMKLLKIERRSNALPSGGFILEYKHKPEPAIRLVTHDSEEDDNDERIVRAVDLRFCRGFEWCPLEEFTSDVGTDTVTDWRNVCKVKRCDPPLPAGKSVRSVECPVEFDKQGTESCLNWARYNYCNDYDTVRWLYCRHTCLCNAEFL